jgi:hypothetical protein
MEARGVVSMEHTVGSKSLAATLSLRCKVITMLFWDAIGCTSMVCVPSTLHHFLIQWTENEIEVVHSNASAYIALVDATID